MSFKYNLNYISGINEYTKRAIYTLVIDKDYFSYALYVITLWNTIIASMQKSNSYELPFKIKDSQIILTIQLSQQIL